VGNVERRKPVEMEILHDGNGDVPTESVFHN